MTSAAALSLAVASATVVVAVPARAHISLDFPKARYWQTSSMQGDQTKLKTSPCGPTGTDTRTKDASLITTFTPGEKVTVKFTETVQHPGHFEISFDSDGQDFPFPGEAPSATSGVTVLAKNIPDKSTNAYTYEITLPNMECEKCTLQLVQVMTTSAPPYSKSGDLYFQCADITLKAGGGGAGGASAGGASGTSGGMAGASSGTGGSPGGGAGKGGSANGGSANGGTTSGGVGTSGSVSGGFPNGGSSSGNSGVSTGGSTSGGASSTGGSATGGTVTTTGGAFTTGGSATGGSLATTGGVPAVTGGTPGSGAVPADEEAGCTVSRSHSRSSLGLSVFALAALLGWQRRRRTSQRVRER